MPLTIPNSTRIALALALFATGAHAQRYTPPEPPPLTTAPCKPTKKDPCLPAAAPTPAAAPAANAFPFPGEDAQDATKAPATPLGNRAGSCRPAAIPLSRRSRGTGPGSHRPGCISLPRGTRRRVAEHVFLLEFVEFRDSDSDPDQPALKDEGSAGSTRFSRRKLPKVVVVDNDQREARDLEVSHYYFTTGNFEAAYMRAKDAVTTIPDDPAAHLALADSAVRLNKPDEAAAEYTACLKLDVSDAQKKAATRERGSPTWPRRGRSRRRSSG